jgi:ATP-binding cassette subfamily F protein uup
LPATSAGKRVPRAAEATRGAKSTAGKLSWKEARELEELPQRIAALEDEQKILGERLADPTLYQTQPQDAQRLSTRLSAIDDELLLLLERWETLEELGA